MNLYTIRIMIQKICFINEKFNKIRNILNCKHQKKWMILLILLKNHKSHQKRNVVYALRSLANKAT